MGVCNPFCCTSIRKGAKRIAIIDIVLFFMTVVVAVGLEWSLFNSVPLRVRLFDDGTGSAEDYQETTIMNDKPGEKHMVGKAIWIHVSNAIQHTREYNGTLGYLMYMGILVAITVYFILEIWLCCILIRAATEKRVQFCKKWLLFRIPMLIFTLTCTGINLAQNQYTVTDVVAQPLNLVRIYSIFVVFQLRKKLRQMDPKLMF